MILGAVIYVLVAGFNPPSAIVLAIGVLALGGSSVASSDGVWDTFLGFFESLLDGIMGVLDVIFSIFD